MLSTYLWCPYGYYLRHKLGLTLIDPPPAYGLQFGLAIHFALEVWEANQRDDQKSIDKFVETFTPHAEPPKLSGKTGKELSATYTVIFGCSLLTAYFDTYRNDTREILQLEVAVAEELDEKTYLCGRIDKIMQGARGLQFADYKSTKYMNDFVIVPNGQFSGYKYLVEKLTGQKASGELDVLGVSKSASVDTLLRREPFDYSEHQMNRWKQSFLWTSQRIDHSEQTNEWAQSWNCKPYFRECHYNDLCALTRPEAWENLVQTKYKTDFWDCFGVN